ncbi:MAG: hypothetical protein NVS2B8_21940 [Vulcanimicrobiaceae bacterium]
MHSPTRRSFVRTGLAAAGIAVVPASEALSKTGTASETSSEIDGTSDPFPIPWLDRNGSHNQVPAPNQEPSHIFHFRGAIARCNDFEGMGTDARGKRLRFGGPTTDIGLMRGSYVATDGTIREGTFLHL